MIPQKLFPSPLPTVPEPTPEEIRGGWLIVTNGVDFRGPSAQEQIRASYASGVYTPPSLVSVLGATVRPELTEEQRWYLAWVHVRSMIANRRAYIAQGVCVAECKRDLARYEARLSEIVRYSMARGWMVSP